MTRRRLLLPLIPLYAAGLRLDRWMARRRRDGAHSLASPVISVGSISAGGAGKTPVVLALAELLRERDYAVRVLTRGYKRGSSGAERVDPEGSAARYGDEPMLLARRSGLPVYVGADRYEAGLLAESDARGDPAGRRIVHLLDDGFQHWRLARDLDAVLLTLKDANDHLLPAGNLREPLAALRRARLILLREEEAATLSPLVAVLTREADEVPVLLIRRTLHLPISTLPSPNRPLAFCGIGRPENFHAMLRAESLAPATTVVFPDHHRYRDRDIDRLVTSARKSWADGFVTTEKDAVKLTPAMRQRLGEAGPLLVPELRVTFADERAALEQLISLVPRLDRRRRGR